MDGRLRELWRRYQDSGAAEDEARLLAYRLRVGQLDPERIELARHLEHPAALLLPPQELEWDDPLDHAFTGWAGRLCERWPDAAVRAGVAAARHAAASCEGGDLHPVVLAVVEGIESWILCPCRACADGVDTALTAARAGADSHLAAQALSVVAGVSVRASWSEPATPRPDPGLRGAALVRDLYRQEDQATLRDAERVAWATVQVFASVATYAVDRRRQRAASLANARAIHLAGDLCRDEAVIRTLIRADVVPWALGYGDPVQERAAGGGR
jgi:hypothetical protein